MVFGFFSRKSGPVVDAGSSTPAQTVTADDDSAVQHFQFPPKQQHTPSPSIDSSSSQLKEKKDPSPTGSDLLPPSGPVDTPSPGLVADDNADKGNEAPDTAILHALIASVPPQTLHAYTLAHLSPVAPSPFPFANPAAGLILHKPPAPPSQLTLSVLTEFFSNLTPPPKLHCVRCHKGYFELENSDRSCLVPHDDDSAIVDRVRTGLGTELETLWGCCGRTVDGDGDQGPPDGWCYEGRHTTDLKRARFRADSKPHDDRLVSCAQLRCGEPPLPRRSTTRASRKRARVDSHVEGAEDTPSIASSSHSNDASKGHRKTASISSSTKGKAAENGNDTRPAKRPRSRKRSSVSVIAPGDVDEDAMEVDDDNSSPPLPNSRPSPPKSPHRPPASSASTTSKSMVKPKRKASSSPKPRSKGSALGTTIPLQKSPLSSSFTAPTPPSQSGPISRPTTPSKKSTRVEVEILTKSPSMVSLNGGGANRHVAKKGSVSSLKDKNDSMILRSTSAAATAGSKKVGGHTRGESMKKLRKTKVIGEVVETSVDGEAEWV